MALDPGARSSAGIAPARGIRRWSQSLRLDRTRERTAALNQLLFTGVVLVLAVVAAAGVFPVAHGMFFAGVVVVFVVAGATLVVPWNRLSPGWLALVPAADIVAITALRIASPASGIGLLWLFPALWLPASLGALGFVGALGGIGAAFAVVFVVAPSQADAGSAILLPLMVASVAGTSFATSRRFVAQRTLLDKQSRLLGSALERARRQEQSVTEVLDAVDFGVIRIAPDGTIAVTNEAHARLQHVLQQEADAVARPAFRTDGVTPVPPGEMPLLRALRGESFDGQVVWFGDPASSQRTALSVTARRLRDQHGRDAGGVLVSRDVTSELTALRARDDLVASVSHELRTPLTSILGYLDLVIDDAAVPEPARRKLEVAERNAERLLGIVADILAASSESRSSVDLTITPEQTDVGEIVRASIESLLPRAAERAVTLDVSGVEPSGAFADPQRVRQIVDNLVTNAIKYNKDGGVVTIGCTSDGDATWVLVRDTGHGMTEAEMAGLFERFYRAQSMRGTGMHGTGLGLSISRDIARAHGGDITVRSTPGVGSTFIVRLPSTRKAASPAPRMPAPEPPPEPETLVLPRRGGRILDASALHTPDLSPPRGADEGSGA